MKTRIGIAVLLLIVAVSPADARRRPKLGFVKSAERAVTSLIRSAHRTETAAKEHATTVNAAAPPQVEAATTPSPGQAGVAPAAGVTATEAEATATAVAGTSTSDGATDAVAGSVVGGAPGEAQALRENSYFYGAFGTTDPFRSLLAGDFEPRLQDLVDMHTVQLVGVIWEPDEIAAMVQDAQGFGYTLRPGDAVKNGTVVSVKRDALVARLNLFGQTTQVTLRLQRDDEELER